MSCDYYLRKRVFITLCSIIIYRILECFCLIFSSSSIVIIFLSHKCKSQITHQVAHSTMQESNCGTNECNSALCILNFIAWNGYEFKHVVSWWSLNLKSTLNKLWLYKHTLLHEERLNNHWHGNEILFVLLAVLPLGLHSGIDPKMSGEVKCTWRL